MFSSHGILHKLLIFALVVLQIFDICVPNGNLWSMVNPRGLTINLHRWFQFNLHNYRSCSSFHFPCFHFTLLLPTGKSSLSVTLSFVLVYLFLLRPLEPHCQNCCDKSQLQHQFSINVWGHNRYKKVLDCWDLSLGYLMYFVLRNDTIVGLLHILYADGFKTTRTWLLMGCSLGLEWFNVRVKTKWCLSCICI